MDVSHFLVMEAIGDSESVEDDDPRAGIESHNMLAPPPCYDHDCLVGEEDDAESCSCEFEDNIMVGFDKAKDIENQENVSEENDEEMMGLAKMVSMVSREKEEEGGGESKRICVVKNEEYEMEVNRVFWETCLEEGYP